jgi:D-glycero-alpha-D-manno-heptose-7-phosphate kinase
MHNAVISNYEKGDERTLDAFDALRACPKEIVQSVYNNDLEKFGEIMTTNWDAQKQLHDKITNPDITQLERLAKNHDALGFKVNGAGGGGSAVILSSTGNEYDLKLDILKAGFEILPFRLNFNGLQVWQNDWKD